MKVGVIKLAQLFSCGRHGFVGDICIAMVITLLESFATQPRGVHLHLIYVYMCENPLFNGGLFTFLR